MTALRCLYLQQNTTVHIQAYIRIRIPAIYIIWFPFSASEISNFSKEQFLYNGRVSFGTSLSYHSISGISKNVDDWALYYPTIFTVKSYISSSNLLCIMLNPNSFLAFVYYSNRIIPQAPVNLTYFRCKFRICGIS